MGLTTAGIEGGPAFIHPGPWNLALFGNKIFADVISCGSQDEALWGQGGPYVQGHGSSQEKKEQEPGDPGGRNGRHGHSQEPPGLQAKPRGWEGQEGPSLGTP